jgi:hypothetical protein
MTIARVLLAATILTLTDAPARAQATPPVSPHHSEITTVALFLAGAAAGLAVHESGHVLAGLTFDANPRVSGIHNGPLPFFAIVHDPVPRRQEFIISSAGFWMQHAGSEWILTAKPTLKDEQAPFLKGVFAFNLAASAVYATAAFGTFGPPERDTRGMAATLGHDGIREPIVGFLVLGPAVLDGYRYLHPEASWAKWTSRSVKIGLVALTMAAGR